MRHHRFLIATSIIFSMFAYGQEQPADPNETNSSKPIQELLAALSAAHEQLNALESPLTNEQQNDLENVRERLNEYDKRLHTFGVPVSNQMWRLMEFAKNAPSEPELDFEPDPPKIDDRLAEIRLPENATEDNIRAYISDILVQSGIHSTYSSIDPEVTKLAAVGPKHVDVLIDFLADGGHGSQGTYVLWALDRVVRNEHKALILERLTDHPELVQIVRSKRWTVEAKPVLIQALREAVQFGDYRYAPLELVDTVAQYRDPETYADLRAYLIHGSNRTHTYDAVKHIPDFDLDSTVEEAWHEIRDSHSPEFDTIPFSPIAANHGHVDALEIALQAVVDGENDWFWGSSNPAALARNLTGQTGSPEEILAWVKEHRNHLVFDSETKKLIVSEKPVAQASASLPRQTAEPRDPQSLNRNLSWPPHLRVGSRDYQATLRAIPPPGENPSQQDVEEFVNQILEITKWNSGWSTKNPAARRIAEVGPQNLETLFKLKEDLESSMYLDQAIESLVKPEHKELVLKYLPQRTSLAKVVTKFGWEDDARAIVIEALTDDLKRLPLEWIDLTIKLAEPKTYPFLMKFYFFNPTWFGTQSGDLARLPGFDPRQIVMDAWRNADLEYDSADEILPYAIMAASYGDADALKYAVEHLDWPESTSDAMADWTSKYRNDGFRRMLLNYMIVPDEFDSPKEWIETNPANIKFDQETYRYIMQD